MKASSFKVQSTPSTGNVIIKLALLGAFVLGSMYMVLMAVAQLTKAL